MNYSNLQVAWKNLFLKSSGDHGTLAFFKAKLSRSPVPNKEPKKDVNASIDFLNTVVKGHWLACACDVLEIPDLDAHITLPPDLKKASPVEQLHFIETISEQVVERLTLVSAAFSRQPTQDDGDTAFNYARILCHYGSLVVEFRDAWAEGDGDRILQCWKLFMPHFQMAGSSKYALEALRLQFQVGVVLSPNLAHQIKWNRFVNTKGGSGRNIPCDLFNEHMNKLIKDIILHMGPNLTENALKKAVRSVSSIQTICERFDKETGVPVITSAHSTVSDTSDIRKTVSVVRNYKLLNPIPSRKHSSFPRLKLDPLHKWDKEKAKTWINEKKTTYLKFLGKFRSTANGESDGETDDSSEN